MPVLDIPVRWAVGQDDPDWRTSGVDRFLRWIPEHGAWCALRLFPTRTCTPTVADEHYGHLLGFHPYGMALVGTVLLSKKVEGSLTARARSGVLSWRRIDAHPERLCLILFSPFSVWRPPRSLFIAPSAQTWEQP